MRTKRNAYTLIEILVAVIVVSAIVLAAFDLLGSGFKTFSKSEAYLANALSAGSLIRQFELDVKRAAKLDIQENQLIFEIFTDKTNPQGHLSRKKIVYKWPISGGMGIQRSDSDAKVHTYCTDRIIEKFSVEKKQLAKKKSGYKVSLTIVNSDPKGNQEKITSSRFVCTFNRNIREKFPEWCE